MTAGRTLALTLSAAFFSSAAHAACPATNAWLRTDSQTAMDAWVAQDWGAFDQAVAGIREDVECMTELPTPDMAARAHAVLAMDEARKGARQMAVAALRGALAADPAFVLTDAMAPADSELRKAFEEAQSKGPGPEMALPNTGNFVWVIDGKDAGNPRIPQERAAMANLKAPDGSVTESKYLPIGGSPDQLVGSQSVAVSGVVIGTKGAEANARAPVSRYLAYGAGGVAVASVGFLATAAVLKQSYINAPPEDGELEKQLNANRTTGYTGYGLGGLAVGMGVTAVLVGQW